MTKDLIFETNSTFDSVNYDKDSDNWNFYFANKIHVSSTGLWRLIKENKIIIVSLDNGHQFGLPKPLDLVEITTKQLTGKIIREINVDKNTGDLTLTISENIKIQIFITSTGYETYEFSILDKRYIGLGSGEIAILEDGEINYIS